MTTLTPLKYIDLSDFTPGIWSGGLLGTNTIPAPLGAAQEEDTYACIASPSGGLIPLPVAFASAVPVPDATIGSDRYYVNGIRALPTGLHYGITWLENGTNNERFTWYRDGSVATSVVSHTGAAYASGWVPQAFSTTVMRLTSAPAPANISIIGSWSDRLGGGGRTWYFPDPANPALNTPVADNTHSGQIFAHQARILQFGPYSYPHGSSYSTTTNELINYTDPPQSTTLGTQQTMLSPESPFGYGAWGSISAGELILIKFYGGAVMMYDDIVYPRVVRLPGVAGTNGFMQQGSFCSIGMVYVSKNNGVFVWNGNNVSQKISSQIDMTRLTPSSGGNRQFPVGFGANTFIAHTTWLDRVVFPQNWLFDPTLNSWWKLLQNTNNIMWWSAYGDTLYGLPGSYTTTPGSQLFTFTPGALVGFYSWKSQPITPSSPGNTASIREVELIAQEGISIATGSIIQITLTSPEGVATVLSFTLTSAATPQKFVQQLDTPLICSNVTVKVTASGALGVFAPTIHSIRIGYGEDRLVGSYYQ